MASHFEIKKTSNLIAPKYYWSLLQQDIKSYIKGCDLYLALKIVKHKLYSNFQFLLILT